MGGNFQIWGGEFGVCGGNLLALCLAAPIPGELRNEVNPVQQGFPRTPILQGVPRTPTLQGLPAHPYHQHPALAVSPWGRGSANPYKTLLFFGLRDSLTDFSSLTFTH